MAHISLTTNQTTDRERCESLTSISSPVTRSARKEPTLHALYYYMLLLRQTLNRNATPLIGHTWDLTGNLLNDRSSSFFPCGPNFPLLPHHISPPHHVGLFTINALSLPPPDTHSTAQFSAFTLQQKPVTTDFFLMFVVGSSYVSRVH